MDEETLTKIISMLQLDRFSTYEDVIKVRDQMLSKITSAVDEKASALKQAEVAEAIRTIRDLASRHNLSAADIGLPVGSARKPGAKPGRKVAAKYANAEGQAWSGRGKRPRWVQSILDQGGDLNLYAVGKSITSAHGCD